MISGMSIGFFLGLVVVNFIVIGIALFVIASKFGIFGGVFLGIEGKPLLIISLVLSVILALKGF